MQPGGIHGLGTSKGSLRPADEMPDARDVSWGIEKTAEQGKVERQPLYASLPISCVQGASLGDVYLRPQAEVGCLDLKVSSDPLSIDQVSVTHTPLGQDKNLAAYPQNCEAPL